MPSCRSYVRRIDMPTSCTTCPVNFFETSVLARSAYVRRCFSYPVRRRGGDAGRDIRRVFPRGTARGTRKVAGSNPPGAPRRIISTTRLAGTRETEKDQLDSLRGTSEAPRRQEGPNWTPCEAPRRHQSKLAFANYWNQLVLPWQITGVIRSWELRAEP